MARLAWVGFAVIAAVVVFAAVRLAVRPTCASISARWFLLPVAAFALGTTVALSSWLLAAT